MEAYSSGHFRKEPKKDTFFSSLGFGIYPKNSPGSVIVNWKVGPILYFSERTGINLYAGFAGLFYKSTETDLIDSISIIYGLSFFVKFYI